jgi:hypothetical protein
MHEIMSENIKRDLEVPENQSVEISKLYQGFSQVIKSKKFENNSFIDKVYRENQDALAVIDLAEACNMFNDEDPPNYKASGICYCNIGNIQYKNGNFD